MSTELQQKSATLNDVALASGFTKAMVSMTLSGKRRASPQTRQAIVRAARELGYRPNPHAQRLAHGECRNMVGLFVVGLDLGVFTLKARLIQQLLSERGYEVPIYSYAAFGDGELAQKVELMSALCRQLPRAVVCTSTMAPEVLRELQLFQAQGGIVVSYDDKLDIDCDQVIFDRALNTYQATRHLIELGHTRIGFYQLLPQDGQLNGVRRTLASRPPNNRVVGVRQALQEAGLRMNPSWLFNDDLYDDAGVRLAEEFLRLKSRPSAMIIVEEMTACMFVGTLLEAGVRVPRDVSVVSTDNMPVARCCAVPLTTVSHPVEGIARQVVELLCSRLDGAYSGPARSVLIDGELIVRRSTTRPESSVR